jgi:ribosome maturation factor RimP
MADKERIKQVVNEWVKDTDCFLVEIKTAPGKIAVFIDKPTGVTLEECIRLNRYLTEQLDAEGTWESNELEVSSPGMEQPLRVYQQYQRRIGNEIKVITTEGREYKGKLLSADEKGIQMLVVTSRKENKKKIISEDLMHIDYSQIKETKLILSFKN